MKNQTNFENLKTGLLFLDFKQGTEEPEYEAMDRMTKKHGIIQKRYQYAQDLDRAIKEAELTSTLLSNIDSQVNLGRKTFDPEEIVSYYDGIFLDYVHQIKDKVFRLIWWMLQDEDSKTIPNEPEHIRLRSFRQYESILKSAGVYNLLHEWDQESSTGISIALKKRLQHHHFVSNLQLNLDFQKIRMSKTMLSPNSIKMLSEYGKTRMKQIGEESYKKWKGNIKSKHANTLEAVEKNLNEIASKLIKYYKIPVDPKEYAKVINKYAEVQKRFDIHNRASIKNIPPQIKKLIDFFVFACKQFFKDHLKAVYLVGSLPRGEFISGVSDINFIIITDFDSCEPFPEKADPRFSVSFLSKKEFLSESGKKYRFICWSDGVLLYGEETKFNEKEFPKPGTFLALLLNRNFIGDLKKIKKEVANLKNPSKETLRRYTVKVARIIMDFGFGVAMSNKPYFTCSRKEKIQYIKTMFPSDQKRTSALEKAYYNGLISQKDFPTIIDDFIGNERKNYEKMLKIEKEVLK